MRVGDWSGVAVIATLHLSPTSRHEQDRLDEAVRNLCKVRMVSTRGGWYKVPADDATSCLNNNELQLGAMLYPEITTIIESRG